MSKSKTPKGNHPTHVAYVVDEYAKGRHFWNRVGSVFTHEDGEGFNVSLIPGIAVHGKMVIRIVKEMEETDGE